MSQIKRRLGMRDSNWYVTIETLIYECNTTDDLEFLQEVFVNLLVERADELTDDLLNK